MFNANGFYGLIPRFWLLLSLLAAIFFTEGAFAVGNDKAPLRKEKITAIVIHAIGGPACKNNRVFFTEAPGDAKHWKNWFERQKTVSIHYVVDRDGNIENSISENKVAWHATDYNKRSIGIELVNQGDGVEAYPEKQLSSLSTLVKEILARHKSISKRNIVRHSDIDSRTFECDRRRVDLKQDPGQKFPFLRFISDL